MAAVPHAHRGIPILTTNLPLAAVSQWRSERIAKLFYYAVAGIFAGLAATGAAVSTKQRVWAEGLVVTLGLGAVSVCAWLAGRSIIDYYDPATLAHLRQEAVAMTLPALVAKHGLKNLQRHSILSPFMFKQKFDYDTRAMSLDKIVERYPLRDLVLFAILTPRQQQLLEEAGNSNRTKNQRADGYKKELETRLAPYDDSLRQERLQARATYNAHPGHLTLAQIDMDQKRQRLTPMDAEELRQPVQIALSSARQLRDLTIQQAERNYTTTTRPIRERYQYNLANDRASYDAHIDALTRAYRFG